MEIGDVIEVTEGQQKVITAYHDKLIIGQVAFEAAAALIKQSETQFWEIVREIVGENLSEKHAFTYDIKDKKNPKLFIAKTIIQEK